MKLDSGPWEGASASVGILDAIDPARTAIARGGASRPLRLALDTGVLRAGQTFFDYGCGRGEDLAVLEREGFDARGWDPAFAPDGDLRASDVVQLGYVLNVISEPEERLETLGKAWALAQSALVVAVQTDLARPSSPGTPLGDGFVTSRGTFQKYFTQDEARQLVQQVTHQSVATLAPGIFAVFREEQDGLAFLARRGSQARRMALRLPRPERPKSVRRLTKRDRKELVAQPFVERILQLGRLPELDEVLDIDPAPPDVFPSTRAALRFASKLVPAEGLKTASALLREQILEFLALARFAGRPSWRSLPLSTQRDVKTHFGGYERACAEADRLLFSAGRPEILRAAAGEARVGKKLPDALYVHSNYLTHLPLVLRVYYGCAVELVGSLQATIVKLGLLKPAVSFLDYPDFDRSAHPRLRASIKYDFAARRLIPRDYSGAENPPILHRKETLVGADYPGYEKFMELTQAEERHGLLVDSRAIGLEQAWKARLSEAGLTVRGHRVARVRRADSASTSGMQRANAQIAERSSDPPLRSSVAPLVEQSRRGSTPMRTGLNRDDTSRDSGLRV